MSLRVSTTGSNVSLKDLGLLIPHPTVDFDLTLYFTDIELRESLSLTTAIQGGSLLVDNGSINIPATDYDPDEVLLQNLGVDLDIHHISNDELRSDGTYPAKIGVFPLVLNSTASVTGNIYSPAGHFYSWKIEEGDLVEITGNVASGMYTVDSVTDQQNFIVNESIVNSTGGFVSIYHPVAATRIGVDPTNLTFSNANDLQRVLEDIDSNITQTSGISVGTHRDIDQLVHLIAEDSYEEYTYSGNQVTSIIVWTNISMTTKIREELYVYIGNKVDTVTTKQYNILGVLVETQVETFTYTGNNVISIDRNLI